MKTILSSRVVEVPKGGTFFHVFECAFACVALRVRAVPWRRHSGNAVVVRWECHAGQCGRPALLPASVLRLPAIVIVLTTSACAR
jgi:hypothetical protein